MLFYDYLLDLDELKSHIDALPESLEEKEELWQIIDEILQLRILHSILDSLDHKYHPDFIELYHKCPYDESLAVFVKDKLGDGYEDLVKKESKQVALEILNDLLEDYQ